MLLKIGYITTMVSTCVIISISTFSEVLLNFFEIRAKIQSLNTEIRYYERFAEDEAEWILSSQTENGALPMLPDDNGKVHVVPYFSCFAAMVLVDYGTKESIEGARKYLEWHFSHMNIDNLDSNGLKYTIYDYMITVKNEEVKSEKSLNSYDSADSYAAVLLMLFSDYFRKTNDTDTATKYYEEFEGAVNVLDSLMYEGLTYTAPDYPVSFLMDNCEVYEGLSAAAEMMETFYVPNAKKHAKGYWDKLELYKKIVSLKDTVYNNIESVFWNNEKDIYEYGIQEGDYYFESSWDELYPGSIAQLAPILSGIILPDEERSKYLYIEFNNNYNWQEISSFLKNDSSFYWSSIAQTAAIMGDTQSVKQYLVEYESVVLPERYYPYNIHESYGIYFATKTCADNYYSEIARIDPFKILH